VRDLRGKLRQQLRELIAFGVVVGVVVVIVWGLYWFTQRLSGDDTIEERASSPARAGRL
jgi:hypothetical protein